MTLWMLWGLPGHSSVMYSPNMAFWHMSHQTRDLNLYPTFSAHWENSYRCTCTSLWDTTQKVTDKWNGQTRSWSRTYNFIQTTNRTTGPNYYPLWNSLTTMPLMQPLGYPHFSPTK